MALPMRNLWANRYAQPSVGATVWGTGINAVHYQYGSSNARLNPVRPLQGQAVGEGPGAADTVTPPSDAVADRTPDRATWGYTLDEADYYLQPSSPVVYDNRPGWDVPPEASPARMTAQDQPPMNATGAAKNAFRAMFGGASRTFRGKRPRATYAVPTETVSEGWLNKINAGPIAKAKPSDPSQYEVQTSMQQRFQVRTNALGVLRGTVDPTSPIPSRVVPQRSPVYSGEERHYDMYPRQQTVVRERPFYYRTAGTGPQDWLEANETWDQNAIERQVPPNPYIGPPSADPQLQYGYTEEDSFYA
jgi:hypothetical protein